MQFEIAGQVREKETGKPLPGLIVQVRDKDMWFDGCLGSVVTDQTGSFRLLYSQKKFQEVFEKQPEIYLTVYEPPLKHLLDTKQKVRWGASTGANFNILISGKKVSPPTLQQECQVQGGLSLTAKQLKIKQVNGFHLPSFPGFGNGATYGSPAILEQLQYVVIPDGAKIKNVEVDPGPVIRKGHKIKPFPIQPPEMYIPGNGDDSIDPEEATSIWQAHPHQFTQPNPRYYQSRQPYPKALVAIGYVEKHEGVQLVRVRVRPLQYDPVAMQYLFYPKLRYTVHFEPAPARKKTRGEILTSDGGRRFVSRKFAKFLERNNASVYPGAFTDQFTQHDPVEIPSIPFAATIPYLIITDDVEWNENEILPPETPKTPIAQEPDGSTIVSHFKRLARWKAQRGVRSRVVTVSEIVNNSDLPIWKRRQVGVQDLQELIRNFVLWAHENWGVEYLLLGGDTNIVPIRKLVGYITSQGGASGWDCMRDQNDDNIKADQCKYYESDHITKIHYFGKADIPNLPLLTQQGGLVITHDQNRTGNAFPRWFCVHDTDFTQANAYVTNSNYQPPVVPPAYPEGEKTHYYVIVEAKSNNSAVIDDDYYWVTDGRQIPTDRYYACASSPDDMGANERDFDRNGNTFPGQFRWDQTKGDELPIDGFKIEPDVFVGRAPVQTPAQARAFVDKVISYERLKQVGTAPQMNSSFLKKVIHVANYSSLVEFEADSATNANPSPGTFTYDATQKCAKIQIAADSEIVGELLAGGQLQYRLILAYGQQDTEIPHKSSGSSGKHWCFMDSSFQTEKKTETRYIKVTLDVATDISKFFWDPIGFGDRFHQHAETLRKEMLDWYPDFNNIQRVYRDCFDPQEPGDPGLISLTKANLLDELDNGCHFLAAMAHGNSNGFRGMKATYFQSPNTTQTGAYIVFAESCSTAYPDGDTQSLGEAVVVQSGGGAVAYVGAARMDGQEKKARWFWDNLRTTRRLGDTSAACEIDYDGIDQFYYKYCRMLYGDPEMPVWVKTPKRYVVSCPANAEPGAQVSIIVKKQKTIQQYEIPDLDFNVEHLQNGREIHGKAHPSIPIAPVNTPNISAVEVQELQNATLNILTTPAKNTLVTLMSVGDDLSGPPEYFSQKRTDNTGKVCFKIPQSLQAEKVEITICPCDFSNVDTQYDYVPAVRTIKITH